MTNTTGAVAKPSTKPEQEVGWRAPAWRGRGVELAVVAVLALGGWGCSLDSLLKSDQLPASVADPAVTETPAGALRAYYGSVALFRGVFAGHGNSFVGRAGLLSDELQLGDGLGSAVDNTVDIDTRSMPDGTDYGLYGSLQAVRGQSAQTIGLLTQYQSGQPALRGHLYALEGYTEVLLAELFCSGIPLSTVDYGGDYTLRPGSTTEQVFQHAIALFDTAGTLVGDSARLVSLVAVGKARALLGLGEYAAAAAAVSAVSDAYRYDLLYTADTSAKATNFLTEGGNSDIWWFYSVANEEGETGLDYILSGDPRSAVTLQTANNGDGFPIYRPAKYASDGSSPVTLASGVEARLIEAEAALQAGDATTWLAKLNALRTGGTADTIADTLGVTGCDAAHLCGTSPGGDDPSMGQPAGGFPVPDGYTYAYADSIAVTPAIADWCNNYAWYAPCYAGDSTLVIVYVHPATGTGGVAGLAPLADPGTADARVDLLFRERAFWLFLTGHRQGDLRRLIRQYGREPSDVYPIGIYPDVRFQYGGDVTMPIPVTELTANPLFTGCASRAA